MLPTDFYLKLPAGAGVPAGKWVRVTAAGANDPLSRTFGPLVQQLQQSFDPASNLGVLKATTTIAPAGKEAVDGVPTTKYTATVDLAKAASVSTRTLAQQYSTLVQNGVKTLRYSIWVDHDQLPRRFATVVPTPQGNVTATGTYRDWGKPVTVAAPPAGQVVTPDQLARVAG
jgi:hypothetical protein